MENYLQLENISKRIGDIILFENISFTINKGQKVALIARNGAGKTSLLNIIAGYDTPDAGKLTFKNGIKFNYLPQIPLLNIGNTIIDEVYSTSNEIIKTVKNFEIALLSNDKKKLQYYTEQMDFFNAWDYEVKIKQILTKLKLDNVNLQIKILSGGQQKRVALAKVLVDEPDLYILDEPTNHLDLEMVEWLEDYLANSKASVLMVTHDRYFLDRVCNELIEMDESKIFNYKGNYSYYLEKREDRLLNQQSEVEKAQNLLRKELDWMRRMPKARGTKAKYRIDQFYELKQKATESYRKDHVNINIAISRLGKKIIEIKKLCKSYGDLKLIDNFSYNFQRFEKVGIIGKNGTGKTTFLNLITKNIQLDSGTIEIGETIKFGYYKQEGLQFNENAKVIDVVREVAEVVTVGNGTRITAEQFLNYFLFPHKIQNNYVYKLSGGEKRRLYLVTVLMQNPNFLILDEPTNDLDIITLNILEEYLLNFQGCVIIVSHDRYFMDKIVDHLFIFKGNGEIKDFPGNFTLYREYENDIEKDEDKTIKQNKPVKERKKTVNENKMTYKEKLEFENIEKEISALEIQKGILEQEVNSGSLIPSELIEKTIKLGEILKLIDEKTNRWLELSEKV